MSHVAGYGFTNTGTILVLFILLVIISRMVVW
ncbi:sporulation protein YjcZ [Gordoniibacillus kamchatkensis]|nr:sporulation protein YjcZ [Paenibacillus sp. VKM B-2647]